MLFLQIKGCILSLPSKKHYSDISVCDFNIIVRSLVNNIVYFTPCLK